MHDLSPELEALPPDAASAPVRARALQLERREVFSVRPELLVVFYAAVATLVGGVGWLIKTNLHRIGPVALLTSILAAAAVCYFIAVRAHRAGRERSIAEDYVLVLGALLFSTAVGYAEVEFRLLGAGWSRHLLLLALWHLASAYLFRSRLVLAVALTSFAGWLGVEASVGSLFDTHHRLLGFGPRALLCAVLFSLGGWVHRSDGESSGFREVYRQFAANFAFWGAIAMITTPTLRWMGAVVLLALAVVVGRTGLLERRQSFLLYAVGYTTIGLVWLEDELLDGSLDSWVGLFTVIGAALLLTRLRARLKESAA